MHNQTTDTRDTNPSPYLNVPLNISAEESFDVRHNASSQLTDHSLQDLHALSHVQHKSALTLNQRRVSGITSTPALFTASHALETKQDKVAEIRVFKHENRGALERAKQVQRVEA